MPIDFQVVLKVPALGTGEALPYGASNKANKDAPEIFPALALK